MAQTVDRMKPGGSPHGSMKNGHIRPLDWLFAVWAIAINFLYYHQFWAQIEQRLRAIFHLWHS